MFENILVCLDGSKLSEAILPLVAELAERLGSKLLLLNVLMAPTRLAGLGKTKIEPKQSAQVSEREDEADCYLERIAGSLSKRGLDVESLIVEGTTEESIVACARTYKVGLIALATRGRSGLGRLILGSTTDFVLRKSGFPVLSINPITSVFDAKSEASQLRF